MVDGTSGPESTARLVRETQHFGRIVVVGGGCYGSYYIRQLARAERANALRWSSVVVVDRDAGCAVAALPVSARPSSLQVVCDDWHAFFGRYLDAAADEGGADHDAIVPSPLMPHLMADWLLDRARARWPGRSVRTEPLVEAPAVPWQRAGDDGTHYVSFAEWMCPINCIEPVRCPHTRGERTWSMPPALVAYADAQRAAGRAVESPLVFHCAHRAFGVGMIDVQDVVLADRAIAIRGAAGGAAFLVGTTSHCHGAVRRMVVGV